jgi:hypothetical protein
MSQSPSLNPNSIADSGSNVSAIVPTQNSQPNGHLNGQANGNSAAMAMNIQDGNSDVSIIRTSQGPPS